MTAPHPKSDCSQLEDIALTSEKNVKCTSDCEGVVRLVTSQKVSISTTLAPLLAPHHHSISDNNESFKLNSEAVPFVPRGNSDPIGTSEDLDVSTCTIQEELLSPLKVDHMAFNYPSQGVNKSSESHLNLSINNVTDETGHEILSNINNLDPHKILNNLRTKNVNRIILSHLNINSIRNKIRNKIDASFPSTQFLIPGFTEPYRRDRSEFGGGLLLYVNDHIPFKLVFKSAADDESLFVEINLYKKKYLIGATYNPCKTSISKHLITLGKDMDTIIPNYDNIILMGDFNCDPADLEVIEFCELFNLKNLIHEPTCFKSTTNPTCIDLILTNRKRSFQNTCIVETGLSDFHKMTLTVLKTFFKKSPPKLILYRDYKNYSNEVFRKELDFILQNYNLLNMSNGDFNILFMKIFDKHAPLKKKYVWTNEGPFMTKELRKEIMKRTKLLNIYRRDKSFRS